MKPEPAASTVDTGRQTADAGDSTRTTVEQQTQREGSSGSSEQPQGDPEARDEGRRAHNSRGCRVKTEDGMYSLDDSEVTHQRGRASTEEQIQRLGKIEQSERPPQPSSTAATKPASSTRGLDETGSSSQGLTPAESVKMRRRNASQKSSQEKAEDADGERSSSSDTTLQKKGPRRSRQTRKGK